MKRERLEIPESNSDLDIEKEQPEEDRRKTNATLCNSIINIYVAQLHSSPIMYNITKKDQNYPSEQLIKLKGNQ